MIAVSPEITADYWQFKYWLIDHTVARDALHIYMSLFLFFGSMLLFRWRLGDRRPLMVVLMAAFLGDGLDIIDPLIRGLPVAWDSNLKDIWNTLFWPITLMLLSKRTQLFRGDALRTPLPPGEGGSAAGTEG